MRNDYKIEISLTITIIVIILIIISVLLAVNFLYFQPQQVNNADNVAVFQKIRKNNVEEYNQAKDDLYSDVDFQRLKKYGNWPLTAEEIIKQSNNPFVNIK